MKTTADRIVKKFLKQVAPFGKNIKEIYLFGSRCRDDWKPSSDYDILVVLENKNREIISKLYDAVLDILLTTGRLVSLKIFSLSEFNRLRAIPTPFMANIMSEGIRLGKNN